MILDAIQSKLATLRDMNNSGNIDCVKMDVVLDEDNIYTSCCLK